MNVADILNKAADLIEPEGAWTRHADARDAFGNHVRASSDSAVCWCAWGAIEKASETGRGDMEALTAFHEVIPNGSIAGFNDAPDRTQAEVVAALRAAAIKAGESQ